MSRIIIYAPSYDPTSGGIIVLHRLCHIMIELGYDAYLYPMFGSDFFVNESYKFNVINSIFDSDIVIYPEIVLGNPLNAKKVVRYIMNTGHISLNRKETWNETDFWIYFSEHFYDGLREKNILHIIDSKREYYKDYGYNRDNESCHTFRKNDTAKNNPQTHIHPENSIEIGFNWPDEQLITIFNRSKKFYSYDTETYLNTLAALCGCESIIAPSPKFTKDMIKARIPVFNYGVKYGEDDTIDTKGELELLHLNLDRLENEPYKIIPKLIDKINEHFKTNITN
jgi:hypothetical protein